VLYQNFTNKVIVVGVDGMDPRFAKTCMDAGLMPNLQKMYQTGSSRENLVLLGGLPTVTPPMWTTLATGANPSTHGITDFFNQYPVDLEYTVYSLDSRKCHAEPLWNVLTEKGKKNTLVWHWPGSSWPPTTTDEHLAVVEGTQPNAINAGVAEVDDDKIFIASKEITQLRYDVCTNSNEAGAGCVITDMEDMVVTEDDFIITGQQNTNGTKAVLSKGGRFKALNIDEKESNESYAMSKWLTDMVYSPLKDAHGWKQAPANAKEFTIIYAKGLVKRPCLLTCGEDGIYYHIAIYDSKEQMNLVVEAEKDQLVVSFEDDLCREDGTKVRASRHLKVMEISENGTYVKLWMSIALDINNDMLFHPKSLHQEVVQKVGVVPTAPRTVSAVDPNIAETIILPLWDAYLQWQADCLTMFMKEKKFDIIFSHVHNVDSIGHKLWHFAKDMKEWEEWMGVKNAEKRYQKIMRDVYQQTDRYLGRFLPFVDEGWTVFLVSDHGLITSECIAPCMGNVGGISVPVMRELGYTVLKKDKNGNDLPEIDWSKTRAVMSRANHIYINLQGRQPYGIVAPEEKYKLEQQIIDDLYNYRFNGRRVVDIVLRNKDALLLGYGGPECGDICYWMSEGINAGVHGDSLSTALGYANTSSSPIFAATGPGVREGCRIERHIRSIDVAPTIAVLTGMPLPAQCEGAPIREMIDGDF